VVTLGCRSSILTRQQRSERKHVCDKDPPRELLPHWLVMKDFDEELLKKVTEFRMHLTRMTRSHKVQGTHDGGDVLCHQIYRRDQGHTKYAIEMGATPKELFATAAQSMLIGGVPAYREGIMAIKEVL